MAGVFTLASLFAILASKHIRLFAEMQADLISVRANGDLQMYLFRRVSGSPLIENTHRGDWGD
jgi:hypothetical protein